MMFWSAILIFTLTLSFILFLFWVFVTVLRLIGPILYVLCLLIFGFYFITSLLFAIFGW